MNFNRTVGTVLFISLCLLINADSLFGQNTSAAYSIFQTGDYERASRVAREELLNSPNNIDSRVVLSWSMLTTGQYQNALEIALETQNLAPNDARVVAVIGEAYYQLGRYLEALPFLERYSSLLPDGIASGRVHSIMGEIFLQFGEYHHATTAFETAVHFDPSVANWWRRLGFAYEQVAEDTLARESHQQALNLSQ